MEAAFYEDFLGRAAEEAGVKMPLTFIPEGISVTTRENEDTEYLFIQNFGEKTETVSVPGITKFSTDQRMKIWLRLPPGS